MRVHLALSPRSVGRIERLDGGGNLERDARNNFSFALAARRDLQSAPGPEGEKSRSSDLGGCGRQEERDISSHLNGGVLDSAPNRIRSLSSRLSRATSSSESFARRHQNRVPNSNGTRQLRGPDLSAGRGSVACEAFGLKSQGWH